MARTKQTPRASTKPKGPPPAPPPPEKFIKPDKNIVRPNQEDIIRGMGRLKKTKASYNPVKLGRELFNSPFYTNVIDWHYDYMPLYHAKNALYSALTGGDVVTIDLYGTDQVTDLFFKVILDFNLQFPSLTKLNLSGCIHLTDQGIKWICKIFKGLHELLLQGCVKLTDRSLYEIMQTYKATVTGITVDMKGTEISVLPLESFADIKSHLKLASCPLISPTLEKHVKYSSRYFDLGEHKRLDVWKVLIFNAEVEKYSVGQYLVEGSVDRGRHDPASRVWCDVQCKNVTGVRPETRLNIVELEAYNECSEILVTEGCVVVLTCTEDDLEEKFQNTVEQLTETVLSIYSKNPNTVVVVCPVTQKSEKLSSEASDEQSVAASLHSALLSNLKFLYKKMTRSYGFLMGETDSKRGKGWLEAALNFPFQQDFGRLWKHADYLEDPKILVQIIGLDKKTVDVSEWIEKATSCVPWHDVFGAEFLDLAELMRKRGQGEDGEVQSREYFNRYNKLFSWDRNIPLPAVWKGVSVLANKGMFTEFPKLNHNPYLYDHVTLVKILDLLNSTIEVTDPNKPTVPCLGLGVPCWHEDSLIDDLGPICSPNPNWAKDLARGVIERLLKQNMLLQLPCKRDSMDHVSFVYVRYAHLPEDPALPLDEYWQRKKPKGLLQLERFYVLIHGMPKAFMSAIFRHLGKVFNFTLLWKQGVYFQTGAVDVLIHLTHSDADHAPALVVAVRGGDVALEKTHIPKQQSTEQYLWAVLKLCTGIVDYVLIKMDLFAKVLLCCNECAPDQDTWTMLNTVGKGLLSITTAVLGVPHREIRCRGICSQKKGRKRFTVREIHGPESVHGKVLTPRHQYQFVERMSDSETFLAYTKCFLCDRCSEKGLRCQGHGFYGKTARHCSCSTKKILCPQCGICSRCTAFISRVETTLMPGLSSATPFDFVSMKGNDPEMNMFKGNFVNCNSKSVILAREPMSPEHFNYVDLTISRGNDMSFGLCRELTRGNLASPMECCEVAYLFNRGIVKLPVVSKHLTNWIVKEGSHVAFHMRHPRSNVDKRFLDWTGADIAVDILLNGQCIQTAYIHDKVGDKLKPQALFPVVVINSPASFMLNAPGIWSVRKNREKSSFYPKQLVEYSFGPEKKACRLAYVGRVTVEKKGVSNITLKNLFNKSDEISSLLYSGRQEALCIHPLGFHATKGYDLEVEMPVFKGTTKEVQSYHIAKLKLGEPELEKLLESFTPADYNCFELNQSCGVVPHKALVRYRLESDCSGLLTYPSELYCRLAQLRGEINRLLFKQGEVSLSGAAAVVLPRYLPAATEGLDIDQKICTQWLLNTQTRIHTLCHSRASSSEMLLMPPKYELTDTSEPYWMVHFLNSPGIVTDVHRDTQMLNLLWASYLALQSRIELPKVYDSMFEEDLSRVPKESLCDWIHKALLLQVHQCLASLPEKLQDTLPVRDHEEMVERMLSTVEGSHVVSSKALVKVVPSFVEDDSEYLLMCPAHSNCTLSQGEPAKLSTFPMDLFSNYSHFISSLEVNQAQLHHLQPEFYDSFPNLVHLDLSNNLLTSLLPDIQKCSKLLYLTLSYNQLEDLPVELASLKCLKRLGITANPMKSLPTVVTQLTNLTKLYAMDLLLETLPKDIGNLEKLEVLSFNGNCLRSLPVSAMKKMTSVEHVSLNGVAWLEGQGTLVSYDAFRKGNFPHWFKEHSVEMSELFPNGSQEGYIEQADVSEVNAKIYRIFPRLGSKSNLQDQQVVMQSQFPRALLYLTNLRYLSLQYQGIVTIPAQIHRLTKLDNLILQHCPLLESLPAELGSLSIKRLVIDECPSLKTPPKEIQAKGSQAVMAYLRRLQTGSVNCRRTKLMMVGLGGAGKTSLVKALLSPELKAQLVSGEDITHGIDISSWTVGEKDDSVTFNVWDFAGQTVYYNTHQFFLSNRAIYMLLWNMRLGYEHAGLDFWLNSISVHAPKAPVFIVGTHADQVSMWELPMEPMKHKYPFIEDFLFVSSYTGQGVSAARDALQKCGLQQPYMGESIPEVWLNFEKAVVQKREGESVVSYKEVEKLATSVGIFDKAETAEAVQFLHELGTLQHFNNEYLKDKVVVDPQWIVDVMACVVSVKDSPIKLGKLAHSDVGRVWEDYPESLHQWLLRLTEEYDLTFPLPDKPINLVPCLLPDKHDAFHWPEVKPGHGIRETKMLYKFVYLPAGLFNRAQVRLYQYSDSSRIWKTGSVLRKNGNLGLVMQTKHSELLVRVQGPRPENVLFLVHEVFEGLISESFQGVSYDYQLPCPDCLTTSPRDVYLFSASNIKRATELKVPFLQCTRHFHTVTLTDLHSIMPPDSHTEYDFHLATAVRGLTDLRKDLTTDIFISYCRDDLRENQTVKVVDPRDVNKDLLNKGFKCYFPEPSSEVSLEQQALAMRDCKVFMALISDSYALDPACVNLFLYARLTMKKPLLMVVLGQGSNWKTSKLGILLAGEVFINMTQPERYDFKVEELLQMANEKTSDKASLKEYPPCFISYSWANSLQAVEKGTRKQEGALGYGDPRHIKDYLEENQIQTWIDIEQVGRVGLFEDIAEGLQNARVMVACVSDQYANSTNCTMEFRFATHILKIPTVLAVVGTGNQWRKSEVGMLSLQGPLPEVNFQDESEMSHQKLLQLVQSHMPKQPVNGDNTATPVSQSGENGKHDQDSEERKSKSFQELFELAQRKFLRQVSRYSEDSVLYPRLIVVDFLEMMRQDMEEEEAGERATPTPRSKPGLKRRGTSLHGKHHVDSPFKQRDIGFKILCEHEEGWHSYADPISAPGDFDEVQLGRFSPYLSRILSLLKHSNQLLLNCVAGEEGNTFIKWMEELPQSYETDFGQVYKEFREEVIKADKDMNMGQLARCHLPSGKTIWLCPEHQAVTRMTLLTNDVLLPGERHTLSFKDNAMAGLLHTMLSAGQVDAFASTEEVDVDELSDDETVLPDVEKQKQSEVSLTELEGALEHTKQQDNKQRQLQDLQKLPPDTTDVDTMKTKVIKPGLFETSIAAVDNTSNIDLRPKPQDKVGFTNASSTEANTPDGSGTAASNSNNPGLFGSMSTTSAHANQTSTFSFGSNGAPPQGRALSTETSANFTNPSLFGTNVPTSTNGNNPGLFGTNSATSTNANNPVATSNTPGLFGGPVPPMQSPGLFGSSRPVDNPTTSNTVFSFKEKHTSLGNTSEGSNARMSGFGPSGFSFGNTGSTAFVGQGNSINTGSFGQSSSGFGNTGNTSVFGQSNFGDSSLFGQSNAGNTGSFGQSNAGNTGSFGQSNTENTGSFGQSNTGNTSSFGQSNTGNTGSFGQSNTGNTSLFGQSNTGNTGSFGQSNTGNTGLFGQSNTGNTSSFGQTNTGNTSSFGQTNTGNPSSFGQSNAGNTGSFGQSNTENTGSFGQSNTGNTSSFGQSNTGNTGSFGQSNTGNTSSFGQSNTGNTGSFGQSNTGNTSLFGQSNTGNTSSFGQSSGGFGNTVNTSVFGQSNFGNTSLFGQSNARNTGLFGQSNTGNTGSFGQSNTGNSSLFGQSNTGNTSLFGQSNTGSLPGNQGNFPSHGSPITENPSHAPHPPRSGASTANSRTSRTARVRERSKFNLERERTKDEIRAISKAALKAAHVDVPQSETCTLL